MKIPAGIGLSIDISIAGEDTPSIRLKYNLNCMLDFTGYCITLLVVIVMAMADSDPEAAIDKSEKRDAKGTVYLKKCHWLLPSGHHF